VEHAKPKPRAADQERREREEVELAALGDDLEIVLRRIGAYLAWVQRDTRALQFHVLSMKRTLEQTEGGKHGKAKSSAGNHD
jgi:hypothetical protein